MDEQVYNRYYDTGGNYHWIGVHSGEHIVRKGEKMTEGEKLLVLMIKQFLDENPDKDISVTMHMEGGQWKHEVRIEPKRFGEWRK